MKVVEIFESIEGEGESAGTPTLFIRFGGCNLRCNWCDTSYSFDGGEEKSVDDLAEAIASSKMRRVSFTGGEPLLHKKEILRLVELFPERRFGIETNGSIDFSDAGRPNLVLSVDYKLPSSGMEEKMRPIKEFRALSDSGDLKFVCTTEDLVKAAEIARSIGPGVRMFFSPVFGKCDLEALAAVVMDLHRERLEVFVSLQMHKIIWAPDRRGV